VLLALLLTCVALAITTVLLLVGGRRLPLASRSLGVLAAAVAFGAAEAAARIWHLAGGPVVVGMAVVFAVSVVVVAVRPQWNPVGQVFYGAFLAAALMYLAFALYVTFGIGLSIVGMIASAILFVFELIALVLSSSFAFESLDVLCRVRWDRPLPDPDPTSSVPVTPTPTVTPSPTVTGSSTPTATPSPTVTASPTA
jgi:hypothetical protein